jgi:hypothetical protein
MKTAKEDSAQLQHAKIAELARRIWEDEGRQAGRDMEYWLRAERQLVSGRQTSPGGAKAAGAGQTEGARRVFKLPASITDAVHT